jgi:hypothetical protein
MKVHLSGYIENSTAATVPELVTPASTIPALETCQITADFAQNHTKTRKSSVFSHKNMETSKSSIPKPDEVVLGYEPPSTIAESTQNRPETKKSIVFDQKHPKTPISDRFDWANDVSVLPTSPTFSQHPPRDLSCLRSTATHPFSSLRRRRTGSHPKNQRNVPQRQRGYWHSHSFEPLPTLHHARRPHTSFRTPISLDWDQDPRLVDLSKALQALGWVRR